MPTKIMQSRRPADIRYEAVARMFRDGEIKKLRDAFIFIPMVVVARDMNIHPQYFRKKANGETAWLFHEVVYLSILFDVSLENVANILIEEQQSQLTLDLKEIYERIKMRRRRP